MSLSSFTIIPIRETRKGARTFPVPIDYSIKVEERWGYTHGEARISGTGRYLLVDISNLGNHRCRLIKRKDDGSEETIETVSSEKFCHLCNRYR